MLLARARVLTRSSANLGGSLRPASSSSIVGARDGVRVLESSEGGVLTVELDRPERLNALGVEMGHSLLDVFAQLADAPPTDVRCVVLTGAGDRAFSTGRDLKGTAGHGPREAAAYMRLCVESCAAFRRLPMPTIAAINGHCFGWGIETAMGADVRVAADEATICFPEAELGIFPGAGGTVLLPRLVGPAAASDLIFSARRIGGQEAARLGLVSRSVPRAELRALAAQLAAEYAGGGPRGVRCAKRVIAASMSMGVEDAMQVSHELRFPLNASADFKEGVSAKAEGRKPNFTGK